MNTDTHPDCARLQKELDRWQESARNWFDKYGAAITEANISNEQVVRLRKQLRHCSEQLDSLKTKVAYALTEDDHRIKAMLSEILNPRLD
jgi:hypothetical protein